MGCLKLAYFSFSSPIQSNTRYLIISQLDSKPDLVISRFNWASNFHFQFGLTLATPTFSLGWHLQLRLTNDSHWFRSKQLFCNINPTSAKPTQAQETQPIMTQPSPFSQSHPQPALNCIWECKNAGFRLDLWWIWTQLNLYSCRGRTQVHPCGGGCCTHWTSFCF